MTISFKAVDNVPSDAEVVGVPILEDLALPEGIEDLLDVEAFRGSEFEGKLGQSQLVTGKGGTRIVALGIGKTGECDSNALRKLAASFVRAAWRFQSAALLFGAQPPIEDRSLFGRIIAEGTILGAYQFNKYKGDFKPCLIQSVAVVGTDDAALVLGAGIGQAVCLARDLVNEPAGTLTPGKFAEIATGIAERENLTIEVLDEVAIANARLGGLMGVARGSNEAPRLIRLVYEPKDVEIKATVALVGKGITFDSGGLSLKNAEGMMTMKTDMSGAAAVLAAMSVVSSLSLPLKVIGIMPTTENMPGGSATKPGDVLTIRNGKTVEVLNTDAEGRLVLADGLSLAVEEGPDAIVDLATLTGACIVALGKEMSGLMSNNDELASQLLDASERSGEPAWRLPLPQTYRKQIDSEIADIKNIGAGGQAGALTAGLFLQEFVGEVPWVHLDIAGPARSESQEGYVTKGGTGTGVRTLIEWLSNYQSLTSTNN